jgi:hypothetical protein
MILFLPEERSVPLRCKRDCSYEWPSEKAQKKIPDNSLVAAKEVIEDG